MGVSQGWTAPLERGNANLQWRESKGVAGGTSANLASLVGQLATANEGEKEGTTLFHR